MRVGVVQFAPRLGEPEANLQIIERLVRGVDADLLVLPEMCTSGYDFDSADELRPFAEEPGASPILERVAALAAETGTVLVGGFAEREGARLFNSAFVQTPAALELVFRKVHLFGHEKQLFSPGDRGFPVVDLGAARVGVMVCFDWVFPESARSLALAGADLICHPSNLVLPFCQEAMKTRCLENNVFALTANRYGDERRLSFTGRSQVVAPRGDLLVRGPAVGDWVGVVDVDPLKARARGITPYNDLFGDRRPEAYGLCPARAADLTSEE